LDQGYREADLAAVAATVRTNRDVVVSSFNLATVDAFHALSPVPTAWLTMSRYDQFEAIETAAARGHRALNPPDLAITADLVAAAHAAGLELMAWTVNDADRMAELAGWGVDVIITDRPAVAVARLRS
jgi:glycerophosphoryl diester phosphodiesterase